MSTDSKLEALRTGLEMAQELLAIKREALGDDYRLTRTYWEAERELQAALADAEQEQAAEAAAVVYSISGQSLTEDAYATAQILNSAGKGSWDLPVRAGTKLYTRPQQPLSLDQIISATSQIDFTAAGWMVAVTRAIEAAHGITKEPKA